MVALSLSRALAPELALEHIHRETGALVVVITHNAVIAEMADRVIQMSDGRIAREQRNARRRAARELSW